MKTYCNPLPVEGIVSGRFLDTRITRTNPRDYKDYRSISDPSVIYFDGKWYLYPSYNLAYVSEDFVHWKHIDIGVKELSYSPAIMQHRGKWYLFGHSQPEMYVSDSPEGPFTLCGRLTDVNGNIFNAVDGCFLADGDRVYIYWIACYSADAEKGEDIECVTVTIGAEMDPDKPWQAITAPVEINRFNPDVEWQRIGADNENGRMGWIEGQWAFKIGDRYYLLHSGSGTQYPTYCNAVIYSDEGPLTGFRPQKNHNPLTLKRNGLLRGAGHGCVAEGPNNTLWAFYTNIFCYNHMYERRISMDPLGIDENGELFCPETTEVPQFAPGEIEHPENGNGAGMKPLTFFRRAHATSSKPGRDAIYAVDDSVLTWWEPEENDAEKTITIPMESDTAFNVEALRIIWRDIGMETLDGVNPGAIKYTVEYSSDSTGKDWRILIDESENETDLPVDYRTFSPVRAYAIRLSVKGAPKGISAGLCSITAFGGYAKEI